MSDSRAQSNNGKRKQILSLLRKNLLLTVAVAFVLTTAVTWALQYGMAMNRTDDLLSENLSDLCDQVSKFSDDDMLKEAETLVDFIDTSIPSNGTLRDLAESHNIAEINIVDKEGIIVASTDESFVGYDMASGEQSAAFLPLLDGEKSIVQAYQPISYDAGIQRKYVAVATEYGFLQAGYDAESIQDVISYEIADCSEFRHIGHGGYVVVADASGTIVSNIAGGTEELMSDLEFSGDSGIEGRPVWQRFEMAVRGVPSYCMLCQIEGYTMLAVFPVSEALNEVCIMTLVSLMFEIIIFIILYLMVLRLMDRLVIEDIKRTNKALAKITEGDLDVVVDHGTTVEFDQLTEGINATVDSLKNHISEEASRIDRELEIARTIQIGALPTRYPEWEELHLFASMDAAKEVGGDFYDFYPIGPHKLGFCVADVSGKGVPAALFMMMSKALIKGYAEGDMPIGEVFCAVNDRLCESNAADMFVTVWSGVLDKRTGHIEFCNAGHNAPIIKHNDGTTEFLRMRASLVMGGMEGVSYKTHSIDLEPGESIFLYTDGVTEATSSDVELYGSDRLLDIVAGVESADATPREICTRVKADVDRFVGEAPQSDDITMLCLRYRPQS